MSDINELQNLIEDCLSVGINFPNVMDENDYAVLFAIAKLLLLHRKRLTKQQESESVIELR